MKLNLIALDYDGTLAIDNAMEPAVRAALADARTSGIMIFAVTGRILGDLRRVAGSLHLFDAVVAEDGGVVHFPATDYTSTLAPPVPAAFLDELRRHSIDHRAGQSLVETDAAEAPRVLEAIRATELPLVLAFNRSRLMTLHRGVSKATGLQTALDLLRLSPRNAIAIGDAENDHPMLALAEVGVAVEWGSPVLRAAADMVIDGAGPADVAAFVHRLAGDPRIPLVPRFRRRVRLGHTEDGREFALVATARNALITGQASSGKSLIAGLCAEELIVQGYSVCVIDPGGDHRALERLPGVSIVGATSPPTPYELLQTLRYADRSVVIDLAHQPWDEKRPYVRALLPALNIMRQKRGLPHCIVLDQADKFLAGADDRLLDLEVKGYIVVTDSAVTLPPALLAATDVIIVTSEPNREQEALLRRRCGAADAAPWAVLRHLQTGQAVVLPTAPETGGTLRMVTVRSRMSPHIRHREKYVDAPVVAPKAFQFDVNFHLPHRAATLGEFVTALAGAPERTLDGYLQRGDFSRWIGEVFGDRALAGEVRTIETQHSATSEVDTVREILGVIRRRYELIGDDGAKSPMGPREAIVAATVGNT
jgi:hypothetical protein